MSNSNPSERSTVRINTFEHPNSKIKGKYNYLADCIQNAANLVGNLYQYPLENHLSLIQKIEFQLQTLDSSYSGKYY